MKIVRAKETKKAIVSDTCTAIEYAEVDKEIHGAVVEITGRYPEKGRVVNEVCKEIGFILKGSGKIVIEDKEISFQEGDQVFIDKGEKYYWDGNFTIYAPCAPAWYPEQHKEVE